MTKIKIDKKILKKIKKILKEENGFKGNDQEIIEFVLESWLGNDQEIGKVSKKEQEEIAKEMEKYNKKHYPNKKFVFKG